MSNNITFRIDNHVAYITLSKPPDSFLELRDLAESLTDLCTELDGDKRIHVLVLSSNLKNFYDMGELPGKIVSDKNAASVSELPRLSTSLQRYKRPIIAVMNGNVTGQGLELVMSCDIRIAANATNLGLPHIRQGLIPWDGGTQRLARLIGSARALEMILTGEHINAKEAHRLGLVNKVAPSGKVNSIAEEMANEMATKGPISLEYAKEAIYKGIDLTLDQGLRLEADLYYLLHSTGDRIEGIEAFREKRKPCFKGK